MKRQHVALTPMLSLFPDEERKFGGSRQDEPAVLNVAVGQLRTYFEQGGTVPFGTDAG